MALFPIQLQSLKVSIVTSILGPVGDRFCKELTVRGYSFRNQLTDGYQHMLSKPGNELHFLNRFNIGHHWIAVAFTYISYVTWHEIPAQESEIFYFIDNLPIPTQSELKTLLEESLLAKGLL